MVNSLPLMTLTRVVLPLLCRPTKVNSMLCCQNSCWNQLSTPPIVPETLSGICSREGANRLISSVLFFPWGKKKCFVFLFLFVVFLFQKPSRSLICGRG